MTDVREQTGHERVGRRRAIGTIGTAGRALLGSVLLGAVAWGELRARQPVGLAVGAVGFPAAVLVWQWLRVRRQPVRFQATGPIATGVNCMVGLAVYLTGWVVPALWFTSDAVLVFYGASMLLAAAGGYAGCEVLAVSNWVLRRDDQVGCVVLSTIDRLDRGAASGGSGGR
jgi:hypothetical protein